MKIEMTADLIGEDGSLLAGQIIDTETDAEAVRFIQAGYARAVIAAPAPIDTTPTQQSIEAELTALGVRFISGADLGSLIALLNASKAPAKPNKPATAQPDKTAAPVGLREPPQEFAAGETFST
jgi:hypothetical protein